MSEDMLHLPREIVDSIIDLLHDDRKALKGCSLISTPWVPRTRKHLFNEVKFDSPSRLSAWKETFPDSAKSPAHHARSLIVRGAGVATAKDGEKGGWIRSFTGVVRFDVSTESDSREPESNFLAPFHSFTPVLRSLRVSPSPVPLSKVFAFICSFPSLEDLHIVDEESYHGSGDGDDDAADFQPATSPAFTGTLVLFDSLSNAIRHRLLTLPGGLHFQKISWSAYYPETDLQPDLVMAFVKRCSNTLECIDIDIWLPEPETPPLDLSRATKLKEITFSADINYHASWVTATLDTITSQHTDLQQVSLRVSLPLHSPSSPVDISQAVGEDARRDLINLDTNLIRLSGLHPIHVKAKHCHRGREEGDMIRKFVENFLPETTSRGLVDILKFETAGNGEKAGGNPKVPLKLE